MSGVHRGGHSHHPPLPVPAPAAEAEEEATTLLPAPNGPSPAAGGHEEEAILAVEGVSFAYPDGTAALRSLSLSIPRHRRVAILGANGSGKSTLFLHLNGILRPAQGRVLLAGQPVRYDRQGLNELRRRVGLVFQDPDTQLFAASVRQDISFGPLNLGLSEAVVREKVAQAIADTQIEELADRPTHLLSYGQKKRVAIAGVLAMEPDVVVADEPTAGLDPEMTARLLELLNRLHEGGRTIVISTHDVELALAWADHAVVLRRGQLLGAGAPAQVFSDATLLRQARLVSPIVLQTFSQLQAQGLLDLATPPPRTAAELVAVIARQVGDRRTGGRTDADRPPAG